MEIRPIRTSDDHAAAVQEIERLWGAEPGTPEGDRLDVLATLVSAYEDRQFPAERADPVGILRFAIEDMGRSEADLARILGSQSRASEVLGRERALTLDMIRAISAEWRLPVEALIQPYETERRRA